MVFILIPNPLDLFASLHSEILRVQGFYAEKYLVATTHRYSVHAIPTSLSDVQSFDGFDVGESSYLLGGVIEQQQELRKLL